MEVHVLRWLCCCCCSSLRYMCRCHWWYCRRLRLFVAAHKLECVECRLLWMP